jgi:hypothetical protein
VSHYLLVYDRSAGRLLREESFADRRAALTERFREETRHRGQDVEVVVLTSAKRADMLRTHGRYFKSLAELAAPL